MCEYKSRDFLSTFVPLLLKHNPLKMDKKNSFFFYSINGFIFIVYAVSMGAGTLSKANTIPTQQNSNL
jgi:hypothetical protein